ncbi:cytochrome c oxidase assembly protein [Parvularcula flava]|uniref:Cytochrome c oxidase assembly protein CtaG n=1 Tax=Aquisalinus luteolus TaxID=1566827 RepID=A0A8J3A0A1_9PROT|nr:cytochrome c oxidase assembly protein [Aquisalinus luteolus]NHK26562.1 cytochrome c oxidase assembly protein [Aquisalinus luteolus]GGH92713.1 cytochrome c oxidase assembly protein CtaG [Aquisalinus luteolus]
MNRNSKTALTVCVVVAGMVGMSFAAVPAYRAFCQITGFDGTTQRADAPSRTVIDREITVRFDATTADGLPWHFKPQQVSQTSKVGQTNLAYYSATNNSDEPVIGTATFNVQPAKAGLYFRKIECFCFTEQVLLPGETMDMPVTYFVDPAIEDEDNLDDVFEITLSYTFYRDEKAEARELAALPGQSGDL